MSHTPISPIIAQYEANRDYIIRQARKLVFALNYDMLDILISSGIQPSKIVLPDEVDYVYDIKVNGYHDDT